MKYKKPVAVGVLAAMAFVLQMLEFSLPFLPSFLKFDFSDIPALLVSFAYGPFWGLAAELVKNLLHCPLTHTSCVGELANFLVGSCLVVPAGAIYQNVRTRKGALIGSAVGTVTSAAVSFPVNMFITYPFYGSFMGGTENIVSIYKAIFPSLDTLPKCLLAVNIPFTFAKGIICTAITFLIYKKISPLLKKMEN